LKHCKGTSIKKGCGGKEPDVKFINYTTLCNECDKKYRRKKYKGYTANGELMNKYTSLEW